MRTKSLRKAGRIFSVSLSGLLFLFLFMASPAQERISPRSIPQPVPQQQQEAAKVEQPQEPLVPTGKEADITIFFTGEAIGYIEECG